MAEQLEAASTLLNAATEVFKTAYTDAFQPGAKELGKAGETLGRAVNAALAPVRGAVWGIEQIESFVKSKVLEKLEQKAVAPEDVQIPDPDIAVPSIEALRYSKLKDEFANLLASSMDKKSAGNAHPSFVEILKQITPDEAKIVRALPPPVTGVPFIKYRIENPNGGYHDLPSFISTLPTQAKIERMNNIISYIDNLQRLRLINIPDGVYMHSDGEYAELEAIRTGLEEIQDKNGGKLIKVRGVAFLTDFGAKFKQVCLS